MCDAALLPYLVVDSQAATRRLRLAPLVCGGFLAVLALAGPTYERLPTPVFRDQSALVLVLDLSPSMNASDLKPSRLERAKFKIKDLLARRSQGQTALVVFAGESYVVAPLTNDTHTIESQLPALSTGIMPHAGSDIPRAIAKASALLTQAGVIAGDILLLTDEVEKDRLDAALKAGGDGKFRVSVLGVGTPTGSPIPNELGGFVEGADGAVVLARLDADTLRELASRGHGVYQTLRNDDHDVTAIANFLEHPLNMPNATQAETFANRWRDLGPWLLLPLLPIAALAFRRGLIFILVLGLAGVLRPPPASAGWWSTPDQQGQRAFSAKNYTEAAQRFTDPEWRAAADYRAGDYAATVRALDGVKSADGRYNRGNALARLGRYQEAIAAYLEVLKQDPAHADAKYNKEVLEELIKLEQPPQSSQQKSDQQKNQKQDQSQAQNQSQNQQGQGSQQAGAPDQQQAKEQADKAPPPQSQQGAAEKQPPAAKDQQSGASQANTATERSPQDAKPHEGKAASDAGSDQEAELATEQWLRQIPDDPGGLLRRKFQYQYQRDYGGPAGKRTW